MLNNIKPILPIMIQIGDIIPNIIENQNNCIISAHLDEKFI